MVQILLPILTFPIRVSPSGSCELEDIAMRHTHQPEEIRTVAHWALHELDLDYAISAIFVGPHQRYEIVLWDRPRNSYFSIRERWDIGVSREQMINRIVQQLRDRVAAWRVADIRYRVRKPRPCRNSLFLGA